jgi:hypothetical protein
MTQLSTTQQTRPATRDFGPAAWRVAGGLAIAHVVILFAAISQEVMVEQGTSVAVIQHKYGGASLTRVFGGGYVESLSILVLVPTLVFLAWAFSRRTAVGRWAAQTFLALGVTFVAATVAIGFAPGAAAMYWSQHGADPTTVAMVNDLRNYGYVLQVAVQAAMALALGIAALAEGFATKWVGWFGVALGVLGLAVTPFAPNTVPMVWLVWWIGVGVCLIRNATTATGDEGR